MNVTNITFVPKKWGYEKIIVNNDEYCGKLLFIAKDHYSSWHYHEKKHETFYISKGTLKLGLAKGTGPSWRDDIYYVFLREGDSFVMEPLRIHRLIGLSDVELFEFSTHSEDSDSIRLEEGQ